MRFVTTPLLTLCFFLTAACFCGAAEDAPKKKITPMDLTSEQFLNVVRNPPGRDSWAKMSGTASHKRKGNSGVESPIKLGILFTPGRTVAQIVFNENEVYNLTQTFGGKPVSSTEALLPDNTKKSSLGIYGITPNDLTMGFLYQPLLYEEKNVSVKGFLCRVFRLKVADSGDTARVFITADYFFPVKVEWFAKEDSMAPNAVPYRTMEVDSFKKEEDFWLVTRLNLYGKDWRTRIEFAERSAGYTKDSFPQDLFLQPK